MTLTVESITFGRLSRAGNAPFLQADRVSYSVRCISPRAGILRTALDAPCLVGKEDEAFTVRVGGRGAQGKTRWADAEEE